MWLVRINENTNDIDEAKARTHTRNFDFYIKHKNDIVACSYVHGVGGSFNDDNDDFETNLTLSKHQRIDNEFSAD